MSQTTSPNLLRTFIILIAIFCPLLASGQEKAKDQSAAVEKALARAGDNRAEMEKALRQAPAEQREGMVFLLVNMPDKDLRSLKAKFLLANVALAYRAKKSVPWGKDLPKEVFLNHVLPYANVDENRDPWRKELFDMCLPLVKNCKTPGEAGHLLNSKVFNILKVKYSTRRKKPHQSPKESIEIGMASCTGLSILLSDACRSVAVPARLVGTPRWVNVPGNHTWVEIWDKGWHFTGACEADPKGLDRGWFVGRAAQAKKDSRLQAIYAASFQRTEVLFPLVWNRGNKSVFAENVTDHYTRKRSTPQTTKLSHEQMQRLKEAAQDFFKAAKKRQQTWKFDKNLDQWLAEHERAVRQLVWEAYRSAPNHADQKKDFDNLRVRYQKHVSRYTVKTVGKRPKSGWPLFIAMHGGGGVPKRINDSQWKVMQVYYRDQKSVPGYKYLALRAPNDSWNGFYDNYVPPLVTNLIQQFLLFGDVDPDKVFLMGYSHGGYGAFFIGPKIPHRFAAIHASAAAPTDGTISPRSLRNTRFTFMIGEKDTRYGRRSRCEKFNKQIQALKNGRQDIYPVEMEFKKGYGHTGLPDRDKIKAMYPHRRNAVPKHLIWDLTDAVNKDFFWLTVPEPKAKQTIEAVVKNNKVEITTKNVKEFDLWLDGRLIDFSRPIQISLNGKSRTLNARPSFLALCRSIMERSDPQIAFTCRIRLRGDE